VASCHARRWRCWHKCFHWRPSVGRRYELGGKSRRSRTHLTEEFVIFYLFRESRAAHPEDLFHICETLLGVLLTSNSLWPSLRRNWLHITDKVQESGNVRNLFSLARQVHTSAQEVFCTGTPHFHFAGHRKCRADVQSSPAVIEKEKMNSGWVPPQFRICVTHVCVVSGLLFSAD
jgi:hypothetical protein